MSNFIYTSGLNNVGSYQVSGVPFCSGGIDVEAAGPDGMKIEFPYVTSWVMVMNDTTGSSYVSNKLSIGFSQDGVKDLNKTLLTNPQNNPQSRVRTNVWHLKITELWLSGTCNEVSIVAGLTNIPVGRVTAASPSGSSWSGSIGVG